jgi:uncharacterized sulfatase
VPAFTQVTHGKVMGRSVRTEQWRYTEWGNDGKEGAELYDQVNDPKEYKNLIHDPAHADHLKTMEALLHAGPGSRR